MSWLLIIGLATWQVVEIWHHSHLFARLRAIVETWPADPRTLREVIWSTGQDSESGRRVGKWVRSWAADLLTCPFCLSVWAGGLMALFYWNGYYMTMCWPVGELTWGCWLYCALYWKVGAAQQIFVYAMAGSRLANLGNDVFHSYCRTPDPDRITETDDDRDDRTEPADTTS